MRTTGLSLSRLPLLGGGILAIASAVGCTHATTPTPSGPQPAVCSAPQGTAAAAAELAKSDTTFGLEFYQPAAAAAGAGQNVILSPYSVSTTLTMLAAGAAGQTETQIQSVLALTGNAATVAPSYAALACDDETDGSSNGNQLSIANSVWAQQGKPFEPAFTSLLATGYGAPLQQVDFLDDAAGAASAINTWVSTETQGEIPTLLQPGDVDKSTAIVLVNAVYFKGAWATAFPTSATTPTPFYRADGSQVSVPTMYGTVTAAQSMGPGFAVCELPYQGNALAMDFLLPTGTLASLESALTASTLNAALPSSTTPSSQVEVFLPKFSFSTRVTLNPVLAGLGMPDVFSLKTADLSGMDGEKDLFISLVVQQAFVEVDEQGTVAAAATAAVADGALAVSEPAVVIINHPFLFLIRDTRTGSILFMGHVEDPSQS